MSDADEKNSAPQNGKRKTDRDKEQPPLLPRDEEFFLWLEKLFYDEPEPAHFPEKLEICIMQGPKKDRYGPTLDTFPFAPKKATKAEREAGAGQAKPTRERLVSLSNELLRWMQRHTNELKRPFTFGVCAIHTSISDEPYSLFCKSFQSTAKGGPDGDDDEDELGQEKRFGTQILRHQEQMVSLFGSGYEGMIDRYERDSERKSKRIEQLEDRQMKLMDMMERALSLEEDRIRKRKWDDLAIGAAQKGIDLGTQLLPVAVNQLTGKTVLPTGDTAETIALKTFFKTKEEGGLLTLEQANAAFGVYGDPPDLKLVTPGVLTPEQLDILAGVAQNRRPPDDLDKLIPGGPSPDTQISQEQLVSLTKIFPMEQIAPIQILFTARYQKLNPQKKS